MKKIFLFFIVFITPLLVFAGDINVLSEEDALIYKEIFDLQSKEKIDKAISLEKKIKDNLLLQEVLYQRYTSKTYRTKGKELSDWMNKYYNTPGANRIYKIAKIKKTKIRNPALPKTINAYEGELIVRESWTKKIYSQNIEELIARFKKSIRTGSSKRARLILEDKVFKNKLSEEDFGRLSGRLSFLYYTNGEYELAKKWGFVSSDAESEYGLWTMGLLYFKEEKYNESFKYFSRILNLKQINNLRKIEAAFWTGRALEMMGERRKAKKYWKIASVNPMSFYGALAISKLGETPAYEFFEKDYNESDKEELLKYKYGKIALGLIQVGQTDRADLYLRLMITSDKSDKTLHAISSVASYFNLPSVGIHISNVMKDKGILEIDDDIIHSSQYPLPEWEPLGGWSIDRALLFAITKQESGFKQYAKSSAGATGLMQLMPKTAKLVAKRNKAGHVINDIIKPANNMYLGQQYIVDLLMHSRINKNIIKMLVAYNSGMGNLVKFEQSNNITDALLYIESFPAFETRNYIKRVMSNLWLYRARLEQDLKNIEDLSDGLWPLYSSEDDYVQHDLFKDESLL